MGQLQSGGGHSLSWRGGCISCVTMSGSGGGGQTSQAFDCQVTEVRVYLGNH